MYNHDNVFIWGAVCVNNIHFLRAQKFILTFNEHLANIANICVNL